MQYQGGKSRISKPISEVINALSRWQIENCQTNSIRDNGGNREREREREYLLVCFAEVVRWKVKYKDLTG